MLVKLYGSHLCQDTMFALMKLKCENVSVEFKNISVDFQALKEFMAIREKDTMFAEVKKNNGVGMPLLVYEDGSKTFDLQEVLKNAN